MTISGALKRVRFIHLQKTLMENNGRNSGNNNKQRVYDSQTFTVNSSGRDYGLNDSKGSKPNSAKGRYSSQGVGYQQSSNNSRINSFNRTFSNEAFPRDEEVEGQLFTKRTAGVNFDSYQNIPVTVSESDYEALDSFKNVDFGEELNLNIKLCGFDKPTPIQKCSIPILMANRDMMACAQTGSGKTAAYMLPIVNYLNKMFKGDGFKKEKNREPYALILCPTRELAKQIESDSLRLTYRTCVKTVVVYGGSSKYDQMDSIKSGCDILVATPGRLIDILSTGIFDLSRIKYFVLDEADRMLDMGFEPQIREILEVSRLPDKMKRQTLMFSATFPPKIRSLASDFLNKPVHVSIGRIGSASDNIQQKLMYVDEEDKLDELMKILNQVKQSNEDFHILLFVDTKIAVDQLEYKIFRQGYRVVSIHGDRSQNERDQALELFRSRDANILVATDVAQRGLDVPNVTHVINYSMPRDIEDYVHRIGRTGRAGNLGISITFFNNSNSSMASDLIDILKTNNQNIPDFLTSYTRMSHSSDRLNFNRPNYRSSRYKSNRRFDSHQTDRSSSDTWNEY